MSKIILQADNLAELRTKLAELDIDVPERSKRRRNKYNKHNERKEELYCVAHLLATLPDNQLSFPLILVHSDKPDFLLTMAGDETGIEHTEAVSENVARAQCLREKECLGPEVHFPLRAKPGEPIDEIRREIKANKPGIAWFGDAPEREWAEVMKYYIGKKIPKVKAAGFARYAANWLIVYDNWLLPAVNYSKAALYLEPFLDEIDAFSTFDVIFIHDDSSMCEFRKTPPYVLHSLQTP